MRCKACFDAMHLLPLNVVKNHFAKLLSGEVMDVRELACKLKQMPWTTDYKSSRLPTDFEGMGYWEAEEYQKLAFLASEFVFSRLVTEDEYKVWAPIPRLVEFVFNAGRDGWTADMVHNFQRPSWRYCILMEEHSGTQACVVNLHNLTHLHEDITISGACSLKELYHVIFSSRATENTWRKLFRERNLNENSSSFSQLIHSCMQGGHQGHPKSTGKR